MDQILFLMKGNLLNLYMYKDNNALYNKYHNYLKIIEINRIKILHLNSTLNVNV